MSCFGKKEAVVVDCHSPDTGQQLVLTRRNLDMIHKLKDSELFSSHWSHLDPPPSDTMWTRLMSRVVHTRPEMRNMLRLGGDDDVAEVAKNYDFRWFCGNFGNFWLDIFSILLTYSEHPRGSLRGEKNRRLLHKITDVGKRHSQMRTSAVLKQEIWNTIREELSEEVRRGMGAGEGLETWILLVTFVVEEMRLTCVSGIQKREALLQQDSIV